MAVLYDKKGKAHKVPFEVDVKEWLATKQFSRTKPKKAAATKTGETPERLIPV